MPEWVPAPAKDLLMRILQVDFRQRISMADIFKHPLMLMNTPGIILPPAPRIKDIALAVRREEIDSDLLRNLCIIWREKGREGREGLATRLCSEEYVSLPPSYHSMRCATE